MFYPIEERQAALSKIIRERSLAEKERALIAFIETERAILSKLSPPIESSGPLRTAQSMLETVKFEQGELERRMASLGLAGGAAASLDGFRLG